MHRFAATAAVVVLVACAPSSAPTTTAAPRAGGVPFVLDKVSDRFDGVVVEVVAVDGYVYVDVAGDDGVVRQVVSLQKPIATGDRVHVNAFAKKDGFHSKKLDRDFPSLWFAVVTVTNTETGEAT